VMAGPALKELFKIGDRVEVLSLEEGLIGSWCASRSRLTYDLGEAHL